jgi:uncharacterized protein (TIGR01370 family)
MKYILRLVALCCIPLFAACDLVRTEEGSAMIREAEAKMTISCEDQRIPFLYNLQNDKRSMQAILQNPPHYLFMDPNDAVNFPSEVAALEAAGTQIAVYVNIGAVENWRQYPTPYEDAYKRFGTLDYEDWPGEKYAAYWLPDYQKLMAGILKQVAKQGRFNLILDNTPLAWEYENLSHAQKLKLPGVDEAFLARSEEVFVDEMRRFIHYLSQAVKSVNPKTEIYLVNGAGIANPADIAGSVAENVATSTTDWYQADKESFRELANAGRKVFLIEYGKPDDARMIADIQKFIADVNVASVELAHPDLKLDYKSVHNNTAFYQTDIGRELLCAASSRN